MTMKTTHRGYTILSAPHFQANWLIWRPHILISRQDERGIYTREFSTDVLFTTMQEADSHGLAFGKRLIEGKVEGQSVTELKQRDRRATPRLRVQFRTTFATVEKVEGAGIMLDLSAAGCRIESLVALQLGTTLELCIHAPDREWPLMVEAARVQWVSRPLFGAVFLQMKETERERLQAVIMTLTDG